MMTFVPVEQSSISMMFSRVAALCEPSCFVGYVFPVAERTRHAVVPNFETFVVH